MHAQGCAAVPVRIASRWMSAAAKARSIYDANFSADEIKKLVVFYQSPVGRKIVVQVPQLAQQVMAMGQSCGEQAGARGVERIRAAAKMHSCGVRRTSGDR
jgi:hypothetical protein